MATGAFVRGIGKPRIKKLYGQSISNVPRNIKRRVKVTGFRFKRRKVPKITGQSFGFSFH